MAEQVARSTQGSTTGDVACPSAWFRAHRPHHMMVDTYVQLAWQRRTGRHLDSSSSASLEHVRTLPEDGQPVGSGARRS